MVIPKSVSCVRDNALVSFMFLFPRDHSINGLQVANPGPFTVLLEPFRFQSLRACAQCPREGKLPCLGRSVQMGTKAGVRGLG
jgi:hypothetical protein